MKGERPLFRDAELVSEDTRKKWRERIDFLLDEEATKYLNDWEAGFVQDIEKRMSDRKDLTLSQSSKLNQIYHLVQEKRG